MIARPSSPKRRLVVRPQKCRPPWQWQSVSPIKFMWKMLAFFKKTRLASLFIPYPRPRCIVLRKRGCRERKEKCPARNPNYSIPAMRWALDPDPNGVSLLSSKQASPSCGKITLFREIKSYENKCRTIWQRWGLLVLRIWRRLNLEFCQPFSIPAQIGLWR